MDLLKALNAQQRRAVEHGRGPLLVLAGAGSGKTRVLTRRIAYVLDRGLARPGEILAVTFTNKAAAEMRQRVADLLGGGGTDVRVGTFHSICARILRRHIDELGLGYDRSFVIYDLDDQLGVLESALEGRPASAPPRALLARIDEAKNDATSLDDLFDAASNPLDEAAAEAHRAYQERLRRNNALDFSDLLLLTLELFRRLPHRLRHYQRTFRYVLVDEYQDTNRAQYRLLQLLAAEHRNLCAVGDEDQSIYRWRGANLRNILDFEKDYPDAAVIRLEQNYRSTQSILAVAAAVIRNNVDRKGKTLWTENAKGDLPVLFHAADERAEARFVVEEIVRLSRERPLGDFVVFYRVNAQSRVFEEECIRCGVPYALVGGLKFYERKEVKDVLAYLRVVANPADEWSLLRIVNSPPRGIGATTTARLIEAARGRGTTLFETLADPPATLSPALRERVLSFSRLLAALRDRRACGVGPLVEEVMGSTGYLKALADRGGEDVESRSENLRELVAVARESDAEGRSLAEFLEQAALIADADALEESGGRVTLMTVHTSKGLEFPVVFVVGLEEGVFPHRRAIGDREEIEEERRLCYVAVTRAREQLFLSRARRRHVFGSEQENPPSRFLREIPAALLDVRSPRDDLSRRPARGENGMRELTVDMTDSQLPEAEWMRRAYGPTAKPRSAAPARDPGMASIARPSFRVGARVRHPTLGEGVVRATEGSGPSEKVTVAFPGLGVRKLAVRIARLEAV